MALRTGLSRTDFPTAGFETCSEMLEVDVPLGRKLIIKTKTASADTKKKDSDRLRLVCLP